MKNNYDLKGIFSREVNEIVFMDGSITVYTPDAETDTVDDGELAEFITDWAVCNQHIKAGELIAVL